MINIQSVVDSVIFEIENSRVENDLFIFSIILLYKKLRIVVVIKTVELGNISNFPVQWRISFLLDGWKLSPFSTCKKLGTSLSPVIHRFSNIHQTVSTRFSTAVVLHFLYLSLDVLYLFSQLSVLLELLLDVGDRIHDGRVISAAKAFRNVVVGEIEHLPG